MKQYLVSENDIKKALKIKDFRNISKEKIVEFFNLIPNMDKDVAKAVVNQFQSYKDLADTSIAAMKEMCNFALEKNDSSQKEVLLAYRKIIDSLADLLKRDDLTKEEREEISDQMVTIAREMALINAENRNFIASVVKCGSTAVSLAIFVGAAILGVSVKGKGIPLLRK